MAPSADRAEPHDRNSKNRLTVASTSCTNAGGSRNRRGNREVTGADGVNDSAGPGNENAGFPGPSGCDDFTGPKATGESSASPDPRLERIVSKTLSIVTGNFRGHCRAQRRSTETRNCTFPEAVSQVMPLTDSFALMLTTSHALPCLPYARFATHKPHDTYQVTNREPQHRYESPDTSSSTTSVSGSVNCVLSEQTVHGAKCLTLKHSAEYAALNRLASLEFTEPDASMMTSA
jgi:hypothetical protein